MAIKFPAKLTLAWWKENKPKSLPKSEIEDLIEKIGETTFAEKKKMFDALGTGSDKESLAATTLIKSYQSIVTEFKRFQAVVHKAKHDDFVKAIDDLIAMAKSERVDLEKRLEAADKRAKAEVAKQTKSAQSGAKSDKAREKDAAAVKDYIDKKLKEFAARDETVSKQVTASIAKIAADGSKARSADEFGDVFGRNRFVFNWLKEGITQVKAEREKFDQIAKTTGGLDAEIANFYKAMESRNSLAKTLKSWQDLRDTCKDLDAKLMKLSVAAIGKEKTAKVFTSAKPAGVRFTMARIDVDEKQIKMKIKG